MILISKQNFFLKPFQDNNKISYPGTTKSETELNFVLITQPNLN